MLSIYNCFFSEKPGDNENSRRDQKSDRGRNQKGRGGKNNNANSFNKKNNLIQTVGFLSEGIAAAPINRRTGEGYGGSSRGDSVAEVLQKPKIVKRDTKPDKADLDAEQKKLTDLLGGDDEDQLNLDDDDSKTSSSDDFLPIKIKDRKCAHVVCDKLMHVDDVNSIVASKRSFVGLNSKKLETEVRIKVEPVDDDVVMGEFTIHHHVA